MQNNDLQRPVGPQATPKPSTVVPTIPAVSTSNNKGRLFGLVTSEAPSDHNYAGLHYAAGAGFDLVFNYSSNDGSANDIRGYLDEAQRLGVKVMFSLKDLYDQFPNGAETARRYPQFGQSNEQIALSLVREFQSHPATYGFSLTDERPQGLEDMDIWRPILADRYTRVKALTAKPTVALLIGWSDGRQEQRRQFLASLVGTTDHFASDYYPIPFLDAANVAKVASDLKFSGDSDPWFIEQAFSWASYPTTASDLGFQVSGSRLPTAGEMVSMGRAAFGGGARNLLFYSYFDISNKPNQLEALKQAVLELKH